MKSVRRSFTGASTGTYRAAGSARRHKPFSWVIHLLTVMFFISSMMSPFAAQAAFAQDEATPEPVAVVVDTDGDGVEDALDATPNGDTDGDGVDNLSDLTPNGDTDGDGVDNLSDATPNGDSDGDGVDNLSDATPNGDTDGDGVDNLSDPTPNGEAPVAEEVAAPVVETTEPEPEPAAPVAAETVDESSTVSVVVAPEEQVVANATVSCVAAEAAAPWIVSDLADYPPGALVTLTGGGWVAGQTVDIFVDDDGVADAEMGPWSHASTVIADGAGAFTYQFNLAGWFVRDYSVVATGECAEARTAFTDAVNTGIDFHTVPAAKTYGDLPFVIAATSKERTGSTLGNATGLLVSFTSTTPDVCQVGPSTLQGDKSSQATVTIAGVGTCGITASQSGGTIGKVDYKKAESVASTIAIEKGLVTVTADAQTRVYGAADPALTYRITSGSLAAGDSFTGSLSRAAGNTVGDYSITQGSLALNSNYTLTFVGAKLSVTARPVTVTADAASKVYGASDPALTYRITSGSLVGSDAFTGALGRDAGEDAGQYNITRGTLALGNNYALTFAGAKFTVTQAAATLSLSNLSHTYDGTSKTATASTAPSGLSVVTITYADSAGDPVAAPTNAGTYTVTATLANTNYSARPIEGALVIAKGRATLALVDADLEQTYDTFAKTVGHTTTPAGLSGVTVEYLDGEGNPAEPTDAGTYTVRATLDNANYEARPAEGELVIGKANQTITFGELGTRTFGDAAFEVSATASSGLAVGFAATGACTVSGATVTITGAGSCTVTASQAGNGNYNAATSVPQTFTIEKANAVLTLGNLAPVYDGTPKAATVTTKPAGMEGDVTIRYFINETEVEAPTNAGSYSVVATLTNDNYVGQVEGTLTIAPAAVTVTARDVAKVYGQQDPMLTFTVSGGASENDFTGALERAAGEDVNEDGYVITQGTLTLSNTNYTLSSFVAGTLTITPAAVTVTADAQTKVYGDTDPALEYSVTEGALVDGDTFTGSLDRVGGEDVGTYAIGQNTLSLGGNYEIEFVGAQLTITRRPVTVQARAATKVYGEAEPALNYAITSGSLVGSDAFTGALERVAGEDAGQYDITQGNLGLSGNYTLSFVGAKLTITQAEVALTLDHVSQTYTGAALKVTTVTDPAALADDIALTYHLNGEGDAVDPVNVGRYEVRATLDNRNYTLVFDTGTLDITARPVTVTADAKTKVEGTADPALTYQITSGSLAAGDSFTGALGRVAGNTVGEYNITQDSLALGSNYDLTFVGAKLTITKPAVTLEITSFSHPIDTGKVVNLTRAGSTIPFKFRVFEVRNGIRTEVKDPAQIKVVVTAVACEGSSLVDEVEQTSTGGTSLRYDTTSGQFIYNWQTPKKPNTCYSVTVVSANGVTVDAAPTAIIKLR